MKAARSISRWDCTLLLCVAVLGSCASPQRAPEPVAPDALEAVPSLPAEPIACSEVRAMVCYVGLRDLPISGTDATSCGAEVGQITDDLLLCLGRAGAACDEVAAQALEALRGCGERLLVHEVSSGGDLSLQRARRFLESWVESSRPWLAVGPLGFVVAPELARQLAASSLRRGDAAGAVGWLAETQSVDAEDVRSMACRWAAMAPSLTVPPRDLAELPSVASAALAWQGCAGR